MSTRQENAAKTRQKLLSVTDKLIRQNGFNKLSIEEITKAAGVAKGTFYVYFKHKEEIVLELCKDLFKETQLKLNKIKDSSIENKLECYFECFIREVTDYQIHIVREWIKGLVEKNKTPDSMGIIKWQYDNEMLKNIISSAVKNKELKADTPTDILTKVILCEMYGMFTCWCMSGGEFAPEKMIKSFCEVQLRTIIDKYKI